MTIASTQTQARYLGNALTSQYAFGNKVFAATDLIVTLTDGLGIVYLFVNFFNAVTGLTYQVNGVDVDSGCTVVFSGAIPNLWLIDIRTATPELQSTSIKNQGGFLPELHEEAFDRLTREVQDLLRLTYTYGIHASDNEGTPWPALPGPLARRGLGLVFDNVTGLPAAGFLTAQAVTAGLIGPIMNPLTAAEIALGIAPTNFIYSADPYVDPRRYGADPTGVADSTGALQIAINVAYQAKGTVWLGNGCNYSSGALNLTMTGNHTNDGFRMMGSMVNGSRITQRGAVTAMLTITGQTPSGAPQESPLQLEYFSIVCSGGKVTDGIVLQGLGEFELKRVYVGFANRAVFLNSALIGNLEQCELYGSNFGCLAREDGAGSGTNLVNITRCRFFGNSEWGIDWGSGDRLKCLSNDMEANGSSQAIAFTAGLGGGATAGVLTALWTRPTGQYPVYFSDGEVRPVSLTQASTAASWLIGLTGAVTAAATVTSGALAIRSTVNIGVGLANLDIDGMWFEANLGQTMFVENTSLLWLAIRNTNFYSDTNGQALLIAGAADVTIEDTYAPGVAETWNISCSSLFLKNVDVTTLLDASTTPTYINVLTATQSMPNGRVDGFTATLTGISGAPQTGTVQVRQQGDQIDLDFLVQITGPSSSAAMTLTGLPAKYKPLADTTGALMTQNNSTNAILPALVAASNGLITLSFGVTVSGAGNKGVVGGQLRLRGI